MLLDIQIQIQASKGNLGASDAISVGPIWYAHVTTSIQVLSLNMLSTPTGFLLFMRKGSFESNFSGKLNFKLGIHIVEKGSNSPSHILYLKFLNTYQYIIF